MGSLSKREIDRILAWGQMLSDPEITTILDEFQEEQPEIYRAIYGELSDAIAEENPEMAKLFLELCFDIIWIYRKAFDKPPVAPGGEEWTLDSLTLLNSELQSLSDDVPMDKAFRSRLQQRFVQRSIESGLQIDLLHYLDKETRKYASFKRKRRAAIEITNNFLFLVVRLMDDLYGRNK